MKYYRVAIRSDVESTWKWCSTVLHTRWTVLQFLRPYQAALLQERLRVFSAASREDLDVQLTRESQGLRSDSLTIAQFVSPWLFSSQEVQRTHPYPRVVSDAAATPTFLMRFAQMYVEYFEREEKKGEELEKSAGGDHDLPYAFDGPSSVQQALAWMRLLVRVQEETDLDPFS